VKRCKAKTRAEKANKLYRVKLIYHNTSCDN